jgi:transcriptional regulator of acetoin/glycerol metabolism
MAAGEGCITRAHLSDDFLEDAGGVPVVAAAAPEPMPLLVASPQTLEAQELHSIRRAVEEAGGNISEASKRLGISRNTIYRKLKWK